VHRRKLPLSVVGIPKTIDNDILYFDQSFGFNTAFSEATRAIVAARNEASSQLNGVGLVKLMGRNSGFVACAASLSMADVHFVLIPEAEFALEGPQGLLQQIRNKLSQIGHAVIVVAEGAGQNLMKSKSLSQDRSGNKKLLDIGTFLKEEIVAYFKSEGLEINLKYIDPSYIIRSVPASAYDSSFCLGLAQNAVHAAMSGRTQMVVGRRSNHMVHLPMDLITSGKRYVDTNGPLWKAVLDTTGQNSCLI